MVHRTKVYIDPKINVDYASFYIDGLYCLFGRKNVTFKSTYFKELKTATGNLRFVTVKEDIVTKYIVNYYDDDTIDRFEYDWCDYYGIINIRLTQTNFNTKKIILLPPSFAIKIWGLFESLLMGSTNYLKSLSLNNFKHPKKFLGNYYKQYKQAPISEYLPQKALSNYIYSVNTLWNSDQWIDNDSSVNLYRANFMRACKSINGLNFEGGFIQSTVPNVNPHFKELIIKPFWIPKKEYINNVKNAIVVFNTPAWAKCHGWKLAEYLALGKAIISTPLYNDLPFPLEHGKNIHFVSGKIEDIKEAIQHIIEDDDYRRKLESGANKYYSEYLTPISSLKILFGDFKNG